MIPNPQQYHMTRLRRVPSAAHSPSDLRVRLGAGTRDASSAHILSREAADDLNHNVFASFPQPIKYAADPRPASRSFVLAALRALHLDPDCGPPPHTRTGTRPTNTKTTKDPHLYGG